METVKKGNVTISREEMPVDENSSEAMRECMYAGAKVRPLGHQLVGFAVVFYYQNTSGDGGAYKTMSKVSHLPEKFADGGVKDLARHCMTAFGRKPPKERDS
jgi:hypothetical protein